MARAINKLTPQGVRAAVKPGRYSDGGGLYLAVRAGGSKQWIFLYRWRGKLTEMGLGGVLGVDLKEARKLAGEAREKVARGINPLTARQASEAIPTFGDAADDYVAAMSRQWSNAKHKAQWTTTLTTDAAKLRPLPVDQVTTEEVLAVLQPIWHVKPETASRLRGRIESVWDWAKTKHRLKGENPARWRGHLAYVLPRRQKLTRGHHAALPYGKVPAFVASLREREAMAALALEFLILTAARSSEVREAKWSEMDLKAKVWTVQATRMKAKREHRVPLTERALEVLAKVQVLSEGKADASVFPAANGGPLSINAFRALLLRMDLKGSEVTPHGFRSSFRDWAGEVSNFPREVAEAALAHVVGDATERAYRRGDALEKRRKLMVAWSEYCDGQKILGRVVPLRA
jgi:integrase